MQIALLFSLIQYLHWHLRPSSQNQTNATACIVINSYLEYFWNAIHTAEQYISFHIQVIVFSVHSSWLTMHALVFTILRNCDKCLGLLWIFDLNLKVDFTYAHEFRHEVHCLLETNGKIVDQRPFIAWPFTRHIAFKLHFWIIIWQSSWHPLHALKCDPHSRDSWSFAVS